MTYNRQRAVEYARLWALRRNPDYYNFDKIGGDCTNFVSQCIFAGSGKMNYERVFGWYYTDLNNRSPSWTGVNFLYKFLVNNKSTGPYAEITDFDGAEIGDIIQLDMGNGYVHSLIITKKEPSEVFVAAHTFDCIDRALSDYSYETARFLHIKGVRI